MKRIAILLFVCFTLAAFAATEHPVSDIILGTPPDTRDTPVLATDGHGFLAVWSDRRSGDGALLAARITSRGEVLDPTGIALTALVSGKAHVLWNGERYLVFYPVARMIMLVTVDREGTVSEPRQVLDNAADIDVATNGSRIVIAYEGDRGTYQLPPRTFIAVLDMHASVITNNAIDIYRSERLQPSIVATASGEFVVAWNVNKGSSFDLKVLPLDAYGVRKVANARVAGGVELEATLHANGDDYVAVSTFYSWSVSADLMTVTERQERPPGTVFQLRDRAAIAGPDMPTHYADEIPRAIEVASFDANGHAGDPTHVVAATPDGRHGIASVAALQHGDDVLFAWITHHADSSEVRFLASVADVETLTPETATFDVTRSVGSQYGPAIAAGATESLVAWAEVDGVYAARINDAGQHLDGRGIRIATGVNMHAPRVAFHDGRYAIAYGTHEGIVIRYVTPQGELAVDTVNIPTAHTWRVALESGGGSLLVAWSDGDVHATRVHPSGTFDPPVTVSDTAPPLSDDPAIGWNGTHFLIAWVHTFSFDRGTFRPTILARRLTPQLQFTESPFSVVNLPSGEHAGRPAVGSNGTDWFVAWDELFPRNVRVLRLGDTASTIVGEGVAPQLAWTGKSMIVAFRPMSGILQVVPLAGNGEPVVIEGTLRPLAYWYHEIEPLGIAARQGRWIAAYSRIAGASAGFVPRVFATFTPNQPRRRSVR